MMIALYHYNVAITCKTGFVDLCHYIKLSHLSLDWFNMFLKIYLHFLIVHQIIPEKTDVHILNPQIYFEKLLSRFKKRFLFFYRILEKYTAIRTLGFFFTCQWLATLLVFKAEKL